MSKSCPLYGVAIYMDCMECEDKPCRREVIKTKYNRIVIGIDQSYKNCGVSVAADGKLKKISSWQLEGFKSNSEKREYVKSKLENLLLSTFGKSKDIFIIIERIRLNSDGFISIDYIKAMGALNACIVDVASKFNIPVKSVDTRSWKSHIVGTSKPEQNSLGIDPKKWPTIKYVKKLGFESSILKPVSKTKKKGVFEIDGERYTYNDDAADSACMALYGFLDDSDMKLEDEH